MNTVSKVTTGMDSSGTFPINGYRHGIYRIWSLQPKWMTVCLSWALF